MVAFKNWNYPDTKIVEEFKKVIPKNATTNKWYKAGDKIVYVNERFYYHLVELKKNRLGVYLSDYVLSRNGELNHSKDYGYFEKKELIEFLNDKGIAV